LKKIAESSLRKAMLEGDVDVDGAVMAGQISGLINEKKSVQDIMDQTIKICKETIRKMNAYSFC
jgi:enoyl-[acyl-carrier protein] reductase II